MKKLLSLLLPLALALSLAACGEKSADEAARQTPPALTVTSANACSVTLKSSSYDWTYPQGLQSMTVIACGAHPLDETSCDITPVLEMPFTVSAAYFYTVTLDFGDNSPDSVSLRCWPSDAWGTTGMPSETVTAQAQDNGTFRAELPQSDGIFAVDALWDTSSATYTFCTQAEGAKELHTGAVLSIGEIIGGRQREERIELLEKRIRELGMNPEDYWWYCDLRRYGSCRHAGFGLGFERMVMYLTGIGNIRDVELHPRTVGNADF